MIKKLICLAGLVVMMSCARSTTGITSGSNIIPPDPDPVVVATQYTSLWASVGGDEAASNTVSGRLPSLTGIEAVSSVESGFNVYASPVIFSDDSGNQYVIALWVNDSSAKLVKYNYENTVLTKDTDFGSETFNSNATGFKAHQISLLVSDSEVVVYVTHGDGLSKVNALTGEVISSSDVDRGAHYSVLVYNDKVYATTSTQIVEYNSSISSAIARSLGTDEIPSIGFPLVVSGDFIYAAKPSTIFKIDLPSDGIGSSVTSFIVNNALSDEVETLSNIVAYNNDGIIYSSTYSLESYSYNFITTVHGFFGSTTHNDGEADFEFYSENRRINSGLQPHGNTTTSPRNASVLGDASYTMLATSGTTVYLSGYYIFNEEFNFVASDDGISAGATPNAGVVSFTPENVSDMYANQVDEKATSFFINNEFLEVELVKDYTSLGGFLSNKVYFSTRFFILDESTGKALSVQNMNESFFDLSLNSTTYSNSGSSGWEDLVDSANYNNEFENYNSRIMIGNSSEIASETFTDSSLEVDSIAVGNNMAVVSASDGKLYLIK